MCGNFEKWRSTDNTPGQMAWEQEGGHKAKLVGAEEPDPCVTVDLKHSLGCLLHAMAVSQD